MCPQDDVDSVPAKVEIFRESSRTRQEKHWSRRIVLFSLHRGVPEGILSTLRPRHRRRLRVGLGSFVWPGAACIAFRLPVWWDSPLSQFRNKPIFSLSFPVYAAILNNWVWSHKMGLCLLSGSIILVILGTLADLYILGTLGRTEAIRIVHHREMHSYNALPS